MFRPGKPLVAFLIVSVSAFAQSITIPNFSFESPPVTRDEKNPFGAYPVLDDWDETAVGLSDEEHQDTGVFLNTAPSEADHITNAHLDRLGFLSSLIGNGIRQELVETFEPGRSYSLTVAVGTSSVFSVAADEELEVGLFYFDGGVEQVVASSVVAGSAVGTTFLIDVNVTLPVVNVGDAWANQPIGVLVRPALDDANDAEGEGFWNVDHARLLEGVGIPTVSTWGLAATALLLATLGTIVLGRRTAGAIAG